MFVVEQVVDINIRAMICVDLPKHVTRKGIGMGQNLVYRKCQCDHAATLHPIVHYT